VTQEELGAKASVSRGFVSKVERGLTHASDLGRLEAVCRALGAELDVRVRWRGEGLDRLLDEAHADLVEQVVRMLEPLGWETALEVTFNDFGDRGSVDVLAWHAATRSLLIVEVKSVIADAQATLAPLDRKTRIGWKIGRSRGWEAASVSRLLVLWDASMNRRRIQRLGTTFETAFPLRGRAVRPWLREPEATVSALLFLPNATRGSARRRATGRMRVRKAKPARTSR
jgi:transcriptional regulator with XRE-family HTH domain